MLSVVLFFTLLIFFCIIEFFCASMGVLIPLSCIVLFYFSVSPEVKGRVFIILFATLGLDSFYGRSFPWTLLVYGLFAIISHFSDLKKYRESTLRSMVVSGFLTAAMVVPNMLMNLSYSDTILLPVLSQMIFPVVMVAVLTGVLIRILDAILLLVGLRQPQYSRYNFTEVAPEDYLS